MARRRRRSKTAPKTDPERGPRQSRSTPGRAAALAIEADGKLWDSRRSLFGALLIVGAGAAVYANSLGGAFVFDDTVSIVDNPNIRRLWPLSESLSGPPGSGSNGRPLVALSLALNYALGGLEVVGYHLANVLLHLAVGLMLFGVVHRGLALARGQAGTREGTRADSEAIPKHGVRSELGWGCALASALLWVVHPLNSSALDHVIYRSEVLMALFYLGTLYAALRAFQDEQRAQSGGAAKWTWLAGLSCLAAVLSKEAAVSAPLVVLLVDRTLVSKTFRSALTRHARLYLCTFASWIALAWLVATSERGGSVGFGLEGLGALDYLRTQAGVLLHYLRLAFWPHPLVLDYEGWPVARELASWLPQGALVVALFALALFGLVQRSLAGLLGLAVFAVLAPSSSFVPLGGMLAGEHRMYLPLAFLVVLGVGAVIAIARRLLESRSTAGTRVGTVLCLTAALALSATTWARNRDYASAVTILQDTALKRPENYRAFNSLGVALRAEGRLQEAQAAYERALEIHPEYGLALNNLGNLLSQDLNQLNKAHDYFERAVASDPERGEFHANRAANLLRGNNVQLALEGYQRAVQLEPRRAELQFSLGLTLTLVDRAAEAIPHYRAALRLRPEFLPAADRLSWLLATHREADLRDGRDALALAQGVQRRGGNGPRFLDTLAAAQAEVGRFDEAAATARRALGLARKRGLGDLIGPLESRLRGYEARRPYREPKP